MKLHMSVYKENRKPIHQTESNRSSILGQPLTDEVSGLIYVAQVKIDEKVSDLAAKSVDELIGKIRGLVSESRNGSKLKPEYTIRFAVDGEMKMKRTVVGSDVMVDVSIEKSLLEAAEISQLFRAMDGVITKSVTTL